MRAPLEQTTNNRPGIPIPTSAMKRPAAPPARYRQSLAPSSNNFAPRQSVYGSQNINPLLLSASKLNSAPYGRTPSQSARRMSQWGAGGGRQSLAPTPMAMIHQPSKDPRAYREKSVQQMMRGVILSVLQSTGFQGNATAKMLASPTAKEFRAIFEHFMSVLDCGRAITGKFEDEFVLIFKDLQYPFADSLDKKWLAAPASMHSWPSLVAALHWMANLVESFAQYTRSEDPTLQMMEQIPDDFDDPIQHAAIAFNFYREAYADFLLGYDDFSHRMDESKERYSQKNQSIVEELEKLKAERDQLLTERSRLSSEEDPLIALLAENEGIRHDKERYDRTVEHWVKRRNKVASQISQEQKRIQEETANLQKLREELEEASNEVKRQNLSDEEVSKMKADHELLVRTVEELKRKKEESGASARSLEIMLASRTESVEQAVDNYTALLENIGLFPTVVSPFPPCDLRLEINFSSPDPTLLIKMEGDGKPANVKRVIKPALDAISEIKRRQIQELEERMIAIENELDTLSADYEREKQDLLSVENKIALLEKQARDTREAAQHETDISNKEAARLEEELASAKSAALSNGVGVRLRLQTLQIAYQEQEDRVKRLKEETIKAIMKNSNDIVNFKREVSDRLSYLQQVAEEG